MIIDLLDKNLNKIVNLHSHIEYMLIKCDKCNSSWGVSPKNNIISKKDLICRKCSQEIVYRSIIKNN
jgi:hypothetical protein